MPYTSAHVLIVFSGAMPGGEEWSIGFRTVAASPSADALQGMADYFADTFRVLFQPSGSSMALLSPLQQTMTACTVRTIGTDGKTIAVAVGAPTVATHGTNSGPFLPNQCALTVSLLTARAGRSYRGRVYLPILNPDTLTTSGRLPDTSVTVAGNFVAALVAAINGGTPSPVPTPPAPPAFFRVAIQSQTSGQPAAPVVNVKTGNVIDTQRRRRDKLVEVYKTQPVTFP